MSTRAIYTFCDRDRECHVYKHHDGYPSGGVAWIANARTYAWPLPRFEADEYAAAFVAACKIKTGPGGVRLLPSGSWRDVAPPDIDYRYVIHGGQRLMGDWYNGPLVSCFKVSERDGVWTETLVFERLPLSVAVEVYAQQEWVTAPAE